MPNPIDIDTGAEVEISLDGQVAVSPQERRRSLLKDLIDESRRTFDEIANAGGVVSGGTLGSTGTTLQQIEEGGPVLAADAGVEGSSDTMMVMPPPSVPPPRRLSATASMRESLARDISMRMHQSAAAAAALDPDRLVQVNMRNFSYFIPMKMDKPTVPTVFNQSVPYAAYEVVRRIHKYVHSSKKKTTNQTASGMSEPPSSDGAWTPTTMEEVALPYAKRPVLKDINLVLSPGKTYLVLGPPGCGKTSLLKAIADRLSYRGDSEEESSRNLPHREGRIEYNGVSTKDTPLIIPNLCSLVAQLDNHAPYLTVRETFEFAHYCRTGNSQQPHHKKNGTRETEVMSGAATETAQTSPSGNQTVGGFTENLTIKGLDLSVCADTFVGNESVRGVSGGQRRRVTVGEMMQGAAPVACADEISTGLDAQVTYDIIHSIVAFAKAAKTTRIVSLLQPGPETFSLFDEVILLQEGMVIFAGPIAEVADYFEGLGYKQPATMDIADFLVSIPTPDGALYTKHEHCTAQEFHEHFKKSQQMAKIEQDLNTPGIYNWETDTKIPSVPEEYMTPYQNSFRQSMMLNFKRFLTLWKRDWGFIIGKMFENIGMAVATGGILFGQARLPPGTDGLPRNEDEAEQYSRLLQAVYGALFMTCLHITLGTMTSAPDEIDGRSIHYKHYDAKFYQVFAFVFGRLLSTIPQRSLEIVSFGIPLYWMVGLDPTAGSFFMYLLLLIAYTTGLKMMFSILAQTLPKKANVQSVGTFFVLIFTLFGGFIVFPDSIPGFYTWLYWINPFAWALQGLASIEFTSSKYDSVGIWKVELLNSRGFQTDRAFIGYTFAYLIPFTILSTVVLGFVLRNVRIEPERASNKKSQQVAIGDLPGKQSESTQFNLPFIPVDLTFDKLVYEVLASTGGDKIRLLNEISGSFRAGRMCALMGSSGAGKTTLLDVIAMRKTSGDITGEIRLNGFPQNRASFLRCSGYVEQFDVQQPELTIRETVEFCAQLRLDKNDPKIGSDEGKKKYAAYVLGLMELTNIQNLQVGSFAEGGLTFEQRKRLSIACELAGSPSVIFLDEPTSGLDSRGAIVVMRALKRIADTGRTVCATIHQPSSAVFEMFDDLLLLKKGGNVVFFGELGKDSVKLIDYFESRGANRIKYGENPAAWMLTCYSGENAETSMLDWGAVYKQSKQFQDSRDDIAAIQAAADESKKISFDEVYVTTFAERLKLMVLRLYRIYMRSPAYNLARLMIALCYSLIIGSVFLQGNGRRDTWKENELSGVISTMFLSLIVIGITSISMAVPVTQQIRDVFYKHRASGMMSHTSLSWSLFFAETPYICLISLLFGAIYYATVGLFHTGEQFGMFWVFFTLNVAIYSYFGQAFICLVKDTPTAGALVGALIGYNIFFSGLVVKPQYFVGPFQLGYWTAPGRFALEGLVITQFADNDTPVFPRFASPYFFYLNCTLDEIPEECPGTIDDYVNYFFGGRFSLDHFWMDVFVLLGYMILAKFVTEFALWKFNYVNT